MTPAGELQAYLRKRVEATGGHYRKLQWEGRKGAPDCFVWWDGPLLAFVEVKAGKDRMSALQRREHDRLRQSGFSVFIVRSFADVDTIISTLKG